HSYRLAVPEHPPVDREVLITHLVAMRHTFGQRRLHGGLARLFQLFHFRRRRQKILRHVAALAEGAFKLLQHQENFAVVPPRLLLGLEDRKSTRLNSSHVKISYAVFCLKKKKTL